MDAPQVYSDWIKENTNYPALRLMVKVFCVIYALIGWLSIIGICIILLTSGVVAQGYIVLYGLTSFRFLCIGITLVWELFNLLIDIADNLYFTSSIQYEKLMGKDKK